MCFSLSAPSSGQRVSFSVVLVLFFFKQFALSALLQAEYSELVETLLSSQRDAIIYQRLADAFNKLTASSTPPTMDRKQKITFLKCLEEFVANVGGLLCVK